MGLQNYIIASVTYRSFYLAIWDEQEKCKENKGQLVFSDVTLCYKVNRIQGTKLLVFLEEQ